MKILENMIFTRSVETHTDGEKLTIDAVLSADHDNAIYQGHFPSRPITPGVVMIGVVVELIERIADRTASLYDVKNAKYLNIMTPDDVDGVSLHIELSDNGIVNAQYTKGDTTYSKLKLLLKQ